MRSNLNTNYITIQAYLESPPGAGLLGYQARPKVSDLLALVTTLCCPRGAAHHSSFFIVSQTIVKEQAGVDALEQLFSAAEQVRVSPELTTTTVLDTSILVFLFVQHH